MNISQTIASFRLFSLPFIIIFIYQQTPLSSALALLLFLIAFLTDLIDAFIIQRQAKRPLISSFLVPFADKIFVLILLFVFVIQGWFSTIPFVIFLLREMIVGSIRLAASRDDLHLHSERFWKIVIYVQYGILGSLLLDNYWLQKVSFHFLIELESLVFLLAIIGVILSFLSIFHYALDYFKLLSQKKQTGKEIAAETILVIANTASGSYHNRYRRRLLRKFIKNRAAIIRHVSPQSNLFAPLKKELENYQHIVIAGGDGSFEAALNNPHFRNKSLGFFPLGSGNAYYSYFYKGKRFEYLRSRFPFRELSLDIMEIEYSLANSAQNPSQNPSSSSPLSASSPSSPSSGRLSHTLLKHQTTFLSVGTDAQVIEYRPTKKSEKFGLLGYLRSSWHVAAHLRSAYHVRCLVDKKEFLLTNCINLTIGKIPYYGFAIRSLVGEVLPDNQLIYACAIVNTHSPLLNKAVRLWGLLLTMLNIKQSPLVCFQGKEMEISSEIPFPIQAGGEFLGYATQLKIKIKRKQKVLAI